MPKLMIMAGGTGGHIFPGLAVAKALPKDWEVIWLGTADRLEAELIPEQNIPFFTIDIKGIRGNGILRKLLLPWMLLRAVKQAYCIIKKERPDAVLGMGGYASGPGGIAAKISGLPLYLHEQNAVLGMTNFWLSKLADQVFTGFPLRDIGILVGNPVREEFTNIGSTNPIGDTTPLSILVVGGSLGAKSLNTILPEVFAQFKKLAIHHQCGKGNQTDVSDAYQRFTKANGAEKNNTVVVSDFINNMASAFAAADLIICRAGALTVAEVAMAGRAAIFIPLPSAVDDHQTKNALYLSEQKAAYLVPQTEIKEQIVKLLTRIQKQPNYIKEMGQAANALARPDATQKIVSHIVQKTVIRV